MSSADGHDVEVTAEIAAPPELVFRYFTDPARFTRWLGARVELEPRVGGDVRIHFEAYETVVSGTVVALDPGRHFEMTWGVAEGAKQRAMPDGSTRVAINLEPIDGGTRVTLRHTKLPSDAERRDHASGWQGYLKQLDEAVRHEVPSRGAKS